MSNYSASFFAGRNVHWNLFQNRMENWWGFLNFNFSHFDPKNKLLYFQIFTLKLKVSIETKIINSRFLFFKIKNLRCSEISAKFCLLTIPGLEMRVVWLLGSITTPFVSSLMLLEDFKLLNYTLADVNRLLAAESYQLISHYFKYLHTLLK